MHRHTAQLTRTWENIFCVYVLRTCNEFLSRTWTLFFLLFSNLTYTPLSYTKSRKGTLTTDVDTGLAYLYAARPRKSRNLSTTYSSRFLFSGTHFNLKPAECRLIYDIRLDAALEVFLILCIWRFVGERVEHCDPNRLKKIYK